MSDYHRAEASCQAPAVQNWVYAMTGKALLGIRYFYVHSHKVDDSLHRNRRKPDVAIMSHLQDFHMTLAECPIC